VQAKHYNWLADLVAPMPAKWLWRKLASRWKTFILGAWQSNPP